MPLYEYTCTDCNEEFEELMPMGTEEHPSCPACSSPNTTKKMSLFGGVAKGSCGSSGFT